MHPFTYRFTVTEETGIGEARRCAAELARELSDDEEFAGRVSVVASEAARNLVRHGGGGELLLRKLRAVEGAGVDLLALDRGPGMRNVAECLRDGFSSGGTAGQGMGAMRRMADDFEIISQPDVGTALWCRFYLPGKPPAEAESRVAIGAVNVPLTGEEECGDGWEVAEASGALRLILADGLGHGPLAADASRKAVEIFRAQTARDLATNMEQMHEALRATRGAAVSLLEVRPQSATAISCGIGNVAMRLISSTGAQQHLLSHRGTVGATIKPSLELSHICAAGSLAVLHSDGLTTQWSLEPYPGLLSRHPSLIAGVLYRDFRRERDDATIIVARSAFL